MQAQKLKSVTTTATYLKEQPATEGRAAVPDFFTSIADGSKSASQAFSDLVAAFEKIVANMSSQMLVFYPLEAILGFVAPDSDFEKSLSAAGPFRKFACWRIHA